MTMSPDESVGVRIRST